MGQNNFFWTIRPLQGIKGFKFKKKDPCMVFKIVIKENFNIKISTLTGLNFIREEIKIDFLPFGKKFE